MKVDEFEFPAKLVMKVETKGTKKIYSVFVIANYHGVQMTLPINDAEAVKEWIRIERSSEDGM